MNAVFISRFGRDFDLSIHEVADPLPPRDTQVRVRVRAAGLNRADILQARGLYPPPPGYSPNIPGLEFAGEIESIGGAVSDWQIGDRVFGIAAGEAQAEYLITHTDQIAPIPDNLSFTEAAAVPEAFITAHDALVTQGHIAPGDMVLIHAVGSGVGLAGLQIAKVAGCFVIGTSRTADKIERCRVLGLDAGVTVSDPPSFAADIDNLTDGKGVNAILDLVGAAYFEQNLASLAPKGRLILVGLTSGARADFDLSIALKKRATIIGTVLRSRTAEEKALAVKNFVHEVLPLLESGSIRANLDTVFPASEVIYAYKYLESNKSFGKVVLEF